MSLAELEARLAHDLACINLGEPDWLVPREHSEGHVFDVAIVGGGQSGLGTAFGLRRERISNVIVLDECPAGFEGPWDTYARMQTLRTPKHLNSIDFHIPSLTYRAWWEAQHGIEGWATIGKIPRRDWMAYLRWYRRVLDLPVRNDAKVELVEPLGGLHRLHLAGGDTLLARKVVFATGIQGGGHWHVPPMVGDALAPHHYAHTADDVDYAALAGKRIAILGGGASAFDNASTALEAGASAAHVFLRRKTIPRVNPIRFMERAGMLPRYPVLRDEDKYALMTTFFGHGMPPTVDMFERAAALPGFDLLLGAPWLSLRDVDGEIEVETPQGRHRYDFLVLSTGLVNDTALRPELRLVHDKIARWSDVYTPPKGLANPVLDAHPYLADSFAFTPRRSEDADAVHGLFAFNYSALVSIGLSAAAISGLAHALPRLVKGVADELFLDDAAPILDAFHANREQEFNAALAERGRGMTGLTTHVLDTALGRPAVGVELRLWQAGRLLFSGVTNEDGRCPGLLSGDEMAVGKYRIEFEIGRYFAAQGMPLPDPPFLDCVAIDFGVADTDGHYHVPLLVSPFGYSTYRGS